MNNIIKIKRKDDKRYALINMDNVIYIKTSYDEEDVEIHFDNEIIFTTSVKNWNESVKKYDLKKFVF